MSPRWFSARGGSAPGASGRNPGAGNTPSRPPHAASGWAGRSEERRVGKECGS